ncbi:MAG TPA: hypothetical protein VGK78_04680 [Nocardioides sp.]|uniref:NADase-type glycan-binding domain-containing protein n=1 Tax=Nocardioides sp. TaxID=35761 RepID=UPI002F3F783B
MNGQTERCAHCGTPATDGRFCTNCGAELGTEPTNPRVWTSPTDTAERVYDVPAPAYVASSSSSSPAPSSGTRSPTVHRAQEPPAYLAPDPSRPRPGMGPGVWIGLAAAMVVVLVLGGFLLLHGGGGGDDPSSSPQLVPETQRSPSSPTSSEPPSPTASSPSIQVQGPPTNVAGFAQASAPTHAPAGVDFDGRTVTYEASNLVDGRNDTCWRTPGDATGTELTFRLDQPTRLTRVGLVNGYSKIAYSHGRAYDWYKGNRRVLSVAWVFDDGSSVTQSFGNNRGMQQTAIKPVTTSTVTLRITSVSPPGKGRAARDETAISEVLLLGRTG